MKRPSTSSSSGSITPITALNRAVRDVDIAQTRYDN